MTPPEGMTSSSGQVARGSLEWSYIQGPSGSVVLQKREDNNQKNIRAQRTSREARKVWRLLLLLLYYSQHHTSGRPLNRGPLR